MIDDGMLSSVAVVGSPKEVSTQIAERFADQVDRVGFYTPYAIPEPTLGELVDALGSSSGGAK